jgi:hypothetical protein
MHHHFSEIKIGDLVEGTSMHNHGLTGYVVDFDSNRNAEYKVHWFVSREYSDRGFHYSEERFYDIKKIS